MNRRIKKNQPRYTANKNTLLYPMFIFQNLAVYTRSKSFYYEIINLLRDNKNIDFALQDQFRRAALSIVLNIAEGTGKLSKADQRKFFIIARGSAFECAALLEILKDMKYIPAEKFILLYTELESISKMLSGVARSLS